MTQTQWIEISIATVCVLLAGMMTAGEAALSSFSRSRAEGLVKPGNRRSQKLLEIMQDPAPYLNTSMFIRVAFEVAATVLITLVYAAQFAHPWQRITYPLLTMVLVSFIVLGVAPRTLGRQHADKVAIATAGPLSLLTTILGPVSQVMIVIGNVVTPGKGFTDGPFSSEAELRELVDFAQASDLIEDVERKMIHSVFELGDTIVKEVMVPRPDMVWIEAEKTLRQGLSLALRSGFSRIPVVGSDLDDVVGILYLKDVIRRNYDNPNAGTSETVESLMRPPIFCPDSKPLDDLLKEMQLTHSHVVIVIDEFGGTAGLATIEDILEEIVGEIVDEFDSAEIPPWEELADGRFRVSSRFGVDELGELFGLKLDDEDVDTVLGLMAKELNQVPIAGATVEWEGLEFVAERASGRRNAIRTVLVGRIDVGATTDSAVDATVALTASSGNKLQEDAND